MPNWNYGGVRRRSRRDHTLVSPPNCILSLSCVSYTYIVPRVFTLIEQAKISEQVRAELRVSEERKEALLRQVHHRVKNNLAVILQSVLLAVHSFQGRGHGSDFSQMENRVHSMALVHESLYRSENLARINFAQALATDILSSHGSPELPVRLHSDLEPVIMSADLAILCD